MYDPKQALKEHIARSRRSVEHCAWFRPVRVGLALLDGVEALDDAQKELLRGLEAAGAPLEAS